MTDLMIDLETLDTVCTAAIVQLGACFFDIETGQLNDDLMLRANVTIKSCQDFGLTIHGDTLGWWFAQPKAPWLKHPHSILAALIELRSLVEMNGPFRRAWCHTGFDAPILANAYRATAIKFPFDYRKWRDIRTLVELSGLRIERGSLKAKKTHDALEDCIYQVEYCSKCWNYLKGKQ